MTKQKKKPKNSKKIVQSPFKNYWKRDNYLLLLLGVVIVTVGYILMAQAPWDNPVSLSLSPVVLLIAYLIIFPLAIFYKRKSVRKEE